MTAAKRPKFDSPGREASLWALVKRNLPRDVHAARIENSVGAGQPDVDACRDGVEAWIELKVKHGDWLEYRAAQLVWTRERLGVRGRVFTLARDGEQLVLYHGGVCLGTTAEPPRPVAGKKAVRVWADRRFELFRTGGKRYDWGGLFATVFRSGER